MVGYAREDLLSERVRWTDLTPPEWRDRTARAVEEMKMTGTAQPWEKEYVRGCSTDVPIVLVAADAGCSVLRCGWSCSSWRTFLSAPQRR
nr:hypothetical protein [Bradyrhizobium elkanii]